MFMAGGDKQVYSGLFASCIILRKVGFKVMVPLVFKDIMEYDGPLPGLVSSAPLGEAGRGGLRA